MPNEGSEIAGGLPILPGTEMTTITDKDLRDEKGRLKPHAQRFRIFAYLAAPDGSYPYKGGVQEIVIGAEVDGKTVESITWQVHMANKKANNWIIPEDPKTELADNPEANFGVGGLAWYFDNQTPNVRNGNFGKNANVMAGGGHGLPADQVDMSDPERLKRLMLDAGPKVVTSAGGKRVVFDAQTPCQYIASTEAGGGEIRDLAYPVQFPHLNFNKLFEPGEPLENMGGMETDAQGRLHVIGAPGYAAGWMQAENNPGGSVPTGTPDEPFPLGSDIDNNGWFDDAGDGPVMAMLTFTDGTTRVIDNPAWCLCADPSYAPQVRNVVTIWDEVYNAWLRAPELKLDENIYEPVTRVEGSYKTSYVPAFQQDVWTMFRAAHLQMFTTDLNTKGIGSHRRINGISASDDPATYLNIKSFIRDPNAGPDNELQIGSPKMPLALGDTGASFLTVTHTQYFFLNQWLSGTYDDRQEALTAGENLTRTRSPIFWAGVSVRAST